MTRAREPSARSFDQHVQGNTPRMREGVGLVFLQGWCEVVQDLGSDSPPGLVGATLSALDVPMRSRRVQEADQIEERQSGLFLFGGENSDNQQTDQLCVYYLQDRKWRKPLTRGKSPTCRSRHSACVIGAGSRNQRVLIFGGVGASNAVVVLDAQTFEWSHPPTRSKPGEKVSRASERQSRQPWPLRPSQPPAS